ncbi:DNA-3-methyladenine glycosylase I [Thalassotalea ganghwensis]
METFEQIYQRAAERKGGSDILNLMLGEPADDTQLSRLSDDRFLSAFTKKIFQSGFVWRVVENKWASFEEVFFNFDIEKILMMPDEMWERKAADPQIIRNFNKVKTIKANAQMIYEQDNFADFIANWPSEDIVGLWAYLKKNGQRLGGNTGPYALRTLGKDTFLLSRDVEAYFRSHDLISGGLQTKASLTTIQQCFNQWQQQSNMSLSQLSKLIAFATGDNNLIS